MAIDLETLRTRLRLDASDFHSGLARAAQDTSRFKIGLGSAIGSVVNFGSRLGFATIGLQGLASGARGLAGALFGSNVAIENVQAQLTAFTGSGEESAKILQQIRDEAAKTPFAFQEMANATTMLLPASKQAGVGLMDLVKQAEVLAALNPAEGLEGAAFALREALSGDFVSLVERFNLPRKRLNELKEQGVPAMEAVSIALKEMGIDASLVSNLAKTSTGRLSTLFDTLSNLKTTAVAATFDVLSGSLEPLQNWLDKNNERFTKMARIAGERLANALVRLGHWLRDNKDRLQAIGLTVYRVVITAFKILAVMVGTVRRHFSTLKPIIVGAATAFLIFYQVIPAIQAVRMAVIGLRVTLLSLSPWFLVIAAAVALFTVAWTKNWFGIRDKTARVVGAVMKIVGRIIAIIRGGKGLHGAIADLPKPVQKIAILFRRLIAIGQNFVRAWQKGGPVAAFRQLSRDITLVGRTIGNFFASIGLERFGAQIKVTFALVGQIIRDVVALVSAVIAGDWSRAWRLFLQLATHMGQLLVSYIRQLPAFLMDVGLLILRVFEAIPWGDVAKALWNGTKAAGLFLVRTGIPWLADRGWDLFMALYRGVIKLANEKIWPWLRSFGDKALAFLKSVPRRLWELGAKLMGELLNGISYLWNQVIVPWLTSLPDRFIAFLKGIPGKMWSLGWDIIQGLWNGVAARWNSFVTWLQGKFDQLPGPLKKVLNMFSPSRVFADMGRNVVAGFQMGIEGAFPRLERVMADMGHVTVASTRMPAVMPTGRGPAVITVNVSGVSDPQMAADLAVRKLVRALNLVDAGA